MKLLPPGLNVSLYDGFIFIRIQYLKIYVTRGFQEYAVTWKWWGENTACTYRSPQEKVEYAIASRVFLDYLKLCEVLEFTVCHQVSGDITGGAFLYDLANLLENPIQQLPVIDHCGKKVGIMSVEMEIRLPKNKESLASSKHLPIAVGNIPGNRDPIKGVKTIKQHSISKDISLKLNRASNHNEKLSFDIAASKTVRLPSKKVVAVEKVPFRTVHAAGKKLNLVKPKVDCEKVKTEKRRAVKENLKDSVYSNSTDPKLLDFLLGKDLSSSNERIALNLLQRVSPSQKFVKLMTDHCEKMPYSKNEFDCRVKDGVEQKFSLNTKVLDSSSNYDLFKQLRLKHPELSIAREGVGKISSVINSKCSTKMQLKFDGAVAGQEECSFPKQTTYNLNDPIERAYFSKFIRFQR